MTSYGRDLQFNMGYEPLPIRFLRESVFSYIRFAFVLSFRDTLCLENSDPVVAVFQSVYALSN